MLIGIKKKNIHMFTLKQKNIPILIICNQKRQPCWQWSRWFDCIVLNLFWTQRLAICRLNQSQSLKLGQSLIFLVIQIRRCCLFFICKSSYQLTATYNYKNPFQTLNGCLQTDFLNWYDEYECSENSVDPTSVKLSDHDSTRISCESRALHTYYSSAGLLVGTML